VRLTDAGTAFEPRPNATMQRAVLDALAQGPVRVAELAADLGGIDGTLKRLAQLKAVEIEHRRRLRETSLGPRPAPRPARLTDGQSSALRAVHDARTDGRVVLLDGVTGSGKTEVYLQAIEMTLQEGRTACVLVPEISLTPQTVGRFRSRFGDEVAVLHSRLSAGERFDQWDRVRRGDARIVVGARSALFAPLKDLGLIVIDEEHEPSYKQGSSPRYHARDVAVRLACESHAAVVLGSATPSLETLQHCERGEWVHVSLPERVSGRSLPSVQVVDMGKEFADGHRSMFSRPLLERIARTVDAGQKAVMFLNRRGFASFLLCRECGFVPRCDSCATSLTFHEIGSRLACHHCGAVRAVPPTCPRCGSPYLRKFGAGTQRVEAELSALIPGVPIVRMDADTTKGKGGHERALAAFESVEGAGVLLGTQMIAKGLDYPDVTLVAVIDADTTLHLPDFRASERTYQLLEQVAGRGGRGEVPGHVVIQTYWPQHPALRAVAEHAPGVFRAQELELRKELGYPPFGRLANVLVWGREAAAVSRSARDLAESVSSVLPEQWAMVGPSPAPLSRLKGNWRWHLLVKAPADACMGPVLARVLRDTPRSSGVSASADIDPVELL
jgi:primosomal protein N' (replication factor Y)